MILTYINIDKSNNGYVFYGMSLNNPGIKNTLIMIVINTSINKKDL